MCGEDYTCSDTAQQYKNVIGLGSAESEYCALTQGGCSGLGLQSLFADWNLKLKLSLQTDSSSAKAVALRRGAGKSTRQIQTRMLWLQERAPAKHLLIVKVARESNPADMLTKALGISKVEEFCAEVGPTEPHAKTVDKNPKEVKQLKKVKFAVEAMETNDAKIENEPNDAEVAKIKSESKDGKFEMDAYYWVFPP